MEQLEKKLIAANKELERGGDWQTIADEIRDDLEECEYAGACMGQRLNVNSAHYFRAEFLKKIDHEIISYLDNELSMFCDYFNDQQGDALHEEWNNMTDEERNRYDSEADFLGDFA